MKKEEAIKILRGVHDNAIFSVRNALETLIPELAESEDERIIHRIKDALMVWNDEHGLPGNVDDLLAYLEKQKEQKPHLELKAGKWYICHRAFCARADHLTVKEGERFQCEKDGIVKGFVIKEPEKYFKECCAPASMEDEQKEQKEIIQWPNLSNCKHDCKTCFAKCIYRKEQNEEQKPAEWSEEEEYFTAFILEVLEEQIRFCNKNKEGASYAEQIRAAQNWLKSLRPQSHWKPSEEQMEALKNVAYGSYQIGDGSVLRKLYDDLKKL